MDRDILDLHKEGEILTINIYLVIGIFRFWFITWNSYVKLTALLNFLSWTPQHCTNNISFLQIFVFHLFGILFLVLVSVLIMLVRCLVWFLCRFTSQFKDEYKLPRGSLVELSKEPGYVLKTISKLFFAYFIFKLDIRSYLFLFSCIHWRLIHLLFASSVHYFLCFSLHNAYESPFLHFCWSPRKI